MLPARTRMRRSAEFAATVRRGRRGSSRVLTVHVVSDPATGVSDPTFHLVSVLYHALQAAQTYDTYILDAEPRGDNATAQFLSQI